MLILDAGCLYEIVTDTDLGAEIGRRLVLESDLAAPHLIDVEVSSVIRRQHLRGLLDEQRSHDALHSLARWNGERFGHQPFLPRVWELRRHVRGWDAFYVALAEAIGCPLLTLDRRLAAAAGLRCPMEVVGA
jgi:predicted nucleic acid-binding protein